MVLIYFESKRTVRFGSNVDIPLLPVADWMPREWAITANGAVAGLELGFFHELGDLLSVHGQTHGHVGSRDMVTENGTETYMGSQADTSPYSTGPAS
ncbi:hypothetical protein [Dyella sp. Tek66A03]|uniref:hypothetical protein n=1 Tax=Dyella sp. Tek66A03 TaxID=3458298 RepID=UPI00403E8825